MQDRDGAVTGSQCGFAFSDLGVFGGKLRSERGGDAGLGAAGRRRIGGLDEGYRPGARISATRSGWRWMVAVTEAEHDKATQYACAVGGVVVRLLLSPPPRSAPSGAGQFSG